MGPSGLPGELTSQALLSSCC